MDDPVPIEGIIEGEPESLAAVCAAGGSAVMAYCSAVGADAYVAETVVAALSTFRRAVVENADQSPAQLEKLLVSSTAAAARHVAGLDPSPVQQAAAVVALEGAVAAPLAPGLAPRIIRALVEAAPVTALGGDPAAVRRATEQHYIRMFDGQAAAAPTAQSPPPPRSAAPPPPRPATPPAPRPATPPAPRAPTPPAPRAATPPARAPRPATAAGEAAWVPPELADLDAEALNARALTRAAQWSTPDEAPAPPTPAPASRALPEHAPPPPPPTPDGAPLQPPAPKALVIKRGGHWPFKRQPRKPHGGGGAVTARRNVLLAAVAGLALGAGGAALTLPEKEVEPETTLVRPLDTPFTIDGAVFNVARTNQALWALEIRRRPLREGRTWLTLAAQTRNINRATYLPRSLGYRVRTPSGMVIGPDTAQVPGNITAARGRLPAGERSSVHLGFQVPSAQRGLTLEFDPSPKGPRIRVPLN